MALYQADVRISFGAEVRGCFGDGVFGPNGFYSFSRFLLISCGQDRVSHGFVGGGG